METGVVLSLFLAFVIKHYLADCMLQSRAMVENKIEYLHYQSWLHAGLHGLGTWIIILHVTTNPYTAFGIAILDTVVHHVVDWIKANARNYFKLEPKDYAFWQAVGLDQVCHYITYIVIIKIILVP